jgi:tRNA pseudouridine55 synthase
VDGVLIVSKPSGPTSHDVVSVVRRRLGERRVGHAGTLDPMAEGVLVLLLGRATRLAEYISGHDKEYEAGLLLGIATDTQDVEGAIVSEASAADVTEESLSAAIEGFRGKISQVPPMYSAVKVDGTRLYRMAREGKTVERQPRAVTVRDLALVSFSAGERARAALKCTVSAGCYIRTLCADIGERLGVGGCMESLVRTASGPFLLKDAVALSEIEKGSTADVRVRVLAPAEALREYPRVDLDARLSALFCNGGFVPACADASGRPDRLVRVHGESGELLGMGEMEAGGERVRPLKVISDASGVDAAGRREPAGPVVPEA